MEVFLSSMELNGKVTWTGANTVRRLCLTKLTIDHLTKMLCL